MPQNDASTGPTLLSILSFLSNSRSIIIIAAVAAMVEPGRADQGIRRSQRLQDGRRPAVKLRPKSQGRRKGFFHCRDRSGQQAI